MGKLDLSKSALVPTIPINEFRSKIDIPPIADEEYPYISVVIPSYNRSMFIKLMRRNIEKINYPPEKVEIIIVDDSTDGSYAKIKEMCEELVK
jgi:cellulose synthase/poly-beta-1,6-N-acetylglucosamine synthase-like glycosyltransferase